MNSVTYLYALSEPEPESLPIFVNYVRSKLGQHGEVRIAVESAVEIPKMPGVVHFPVGTGPMAMFNQLAAREQPSQVLFFNQGTALPILSPGAMSRLATLPEGSCLTLDGRRPILSQQLELEEMLDLDWDDVEFSRSVHEESPLSFAVGREEFLRIRGFDERVSFSATYIMDLLARFRRFAMVHSRLAPLDGYSMDLEPVFPGLTSERLPLNVSVRENQKAHVLSDASIFRNLVKWSVPQDRRPVLVSVAIATRDRSDYLMDSIRSVQIQSFEDWELLVVDDGSEDETQKVVESVADPRVKYLHQEAKGISAARNLAADNSNGYYTAVHDDDDIMLPWRLETSLSTIGANAQASYGSWVNFDDVTGDMALHITKRDFGQELVAFSGQTPGHATWLLPTAIIRALRYDETLTSSVDHNIAVRTVMSGLKWKHSEKVLFLRRLHPTQVSQTDSRRQRAAAILTRYANTFTADFNGLKSVVERGKSLTFPAPADKQRLFCIFGAYLPDHLVRRGMTLRNLVGKKVLALDLHDRFQFVISETDLLTDRSTLELGGVSEVTWDDLVAVRNSGFTGCTYTFAARGDDLEAKPGDSEIDRSAGDILRDRLLGHLDSSRKASAPAVLLSIEGEHLTHESLQGVDGLLSARHFSINHDPYARVSRLLLGFRDEVRARSYVDRNDFSDWSIILPTERDIVAASNRHLGV